jgi:hypothetical protein
MLHIITDEQLEQYNKGLKALFIVERVETYAEKFISKIRCETEGGGYCDNCPIGKLPRRMDDNDLCMAGKDMQYSK